MKLHIKSALSQDGKEHTYPLFNTEDFEKLFVEFPQLKESMVKYSDVRLIAKDIAGYLNKHHMHAWVTED